MIKTWNNASFPEPFLDYNQSSPKEVIITLTLIINDSLLLFFVLSPMYVSLINVVECGLAQDVVLSTTHDPFHHLW